jgi:hypothetical protein
MGLIQNIQLLNLLNFLPLDSATKYTQFGLLHLLRPIIYWDIEHFTVHCILELSMLVLWTIMTSWYLTLLKNNFRHWASSGWDPCLNSFVDVITWQQTCILFPHVLILWRIGKLSFSSTGVDESLDIAWSDGDLMF